MAELYLIANSAMPTTAAQASVTTGTVIKSLMQVTLNASQTFRAKVVEWGISFDGSTAATPIKCELLTVDVAGTVTTAYSTTNELATANGYTQAGQSFGALTLAGTTTVTVDDPADIVWTASGGSITARYAVIYDDSDATTPKAIICYCLLDSTPADVTVTTGNTLTISLSVSGIFTLA